MLTENGFNLDLDAVREVFTKADLITVGFASFPERLLIDPRTLPDEGPLVAIVAPVASVQERYLWLGKHRSSFGAPEALAPLGARLDAPAREALDEALQVALELERLAMLEAVKGSERWPAIWERPAA